MTTYRKPAPYGEIPDTKSMRRSPQKTNNMNEKITVQDIFDMPIDEIRELTREIKRLTKEADILIEKGIIIEAKSLKELLNLIKDNK